MVSVDFAEVRVKVCIGLEDERLLGMAVFLPVGSLADLVETFSALMWSGYPEVSFWAGSWLSTWNLLQTYSLGLGDTSNGFTGQLGYLQLCADRVWSTSGQGLCSLTSCKWVLA